MKKITIYKYKSLASLEYFLDILLYKRLFGAKYSELNDPFEAYILGDNLNEKIYQERSVARICSASKTPYNGLMWSHYADGHKGCCIEFTTTSKTWDMIEVVYEDTLKEITNTTPITDILKHKLKLWEYEKEIRFVKQINPQRPQNVYLPIRISKVYLGVKMNRTKRAFIKKLIATIDEKIDVIDIKREDLINNINN